MKTAFRDVTQCSLVGCTDSPFPEYSSILKIEASDSSKHQCKSTRLHNMTSQNTVILITVSFQMLLGESPTHLKFLHLRLSSV